MMRATQALMPGVYGQENLSKMKLCILLCLCILAFSGLPASGEIVVEEFFISTPGLVQRPDISGNIVVWLDWGVGQIWGCDLTVGETFPVGSHVAGQQYVAISGNTVVWSDYRNGPVGNLDIYGYDVSTGEEFPICTDSGGQVYPDVSGDYVIWQDQYTRYWHPWLGTGIVGGQSRYPVISGNIVVWVSDDDPDTYSIYGENLTTGDRFPVCTNSHFQYFPAISGNIVV